MPFVHADDALAVSNAWSLAHAQNAELDAVARIRSEAGKFRWFRIRARSFAHGDEPIAQWFGTLVDVHDRQLAMDANSHVVNALMKGYLSKPFPIVAGLTPPLIREHGFSYEPGALVVIYTDGLIEFSHDIFDGEARLLIAAADAVRCKAHDPASFIGNRVLGDVTPRDDVAILTLLFRP